MEHSTCLQELDLDDNLIGDVGGCEIMEGLKARKDSGLEGVIVFSCKLMFLELIILNWFYPFFRLVEHSACLQELDLDDNLIGDLGGCEIMEGLKARKDSGLEGVIVFSCKLMFLELIILNWFYPFFRLVEHSACLQELDLDDNLIGDLGGREIMEGLKGRKESGLEGAKVSVTHRMNGDTFGEIMKLGSGLKKKKKKGKGKKKVCSYFPDLSFIGRIFLGPLMQSCQLSTFLPYFVCFLKENTAVRFFMHKIRFFSDFFFFFFFFYWRVQSSEKYTHYLCYENLGRVFE